MAHVGFVDVKLDYQINEDRLLFSILISHGDLHILFYRLLQPFIHQVPAITLISFDYVVFILHPLSQSFTFLPGSDLLRCLLQDRLLTPFVSHFLIVTHRPLVDPMRPHLLEILQLGLVQDCVILVSNLLVSLLLHLLVNQCEELELKTIPLLLGALRKAQVSKENSSGVILAS